jgi:hypothetical protein
MIEGFLIDRKIIHEDFHDFFNHVREDRHHATLERCRSVAKPE